MFKIHSYVLYTQWRGATNERGYVVAPYTQPFSRWLIAKAYSWYDMKIQKIPGYQLAGFLHMYWHARVLRTPPDDYMPLSVLQDLKCFYLSRKGRVELRGAEISGDDYKKLGGHHLWREDNEDAEGPDGGPVQEVRGGDPAAPTP
jgi:hypothetical protein